MQVYSDPARESDPFALPDVEVFEVNAHDLQHDFREFAIERMKEDSSLLPSDLIGWYWWTCFPGCMPDSDPTGPFKTKAEAIADAQENAQ